MENHCKIKANAVIFDKDGTLIDFDAFWVSLSDAAIKDVLTQLDQEQSLATEILEAFGIHNGVTDVNGVLCKGTYGQMAQIMHDILTRYGCQTPPETIEPMMVNSYNKNIASGLVKPTCPNLCDTLIALKTQNKKLAVVTTDNRQITFFCLEQLGILDLFDHIYTDDGVFPAKPHPACATDFCASADLDKNSVVMVGDTVTDLSFARNAGIKMIGVAKTETNRQLFVGTADAVVRDVSELLNILE